VAQPLTIGDDRLRLTIDRADGDLSEAGFRANGADMTGLMGSPWRVETDNGVLVPSSRNVSESSGKHGVTLKGTTSEFNWTLAYEVTGLGRITKTLALTARTDTVLKRVWLWDAASDREPSVAGTGLQDIAAFYREEGAGLFVSLDFPYSRIDCEKGRAAIGYPPFEKLRAGETYTCHSLTIGATRLTGQARYGWDEGEVVAMDAYIQERYKPRFDGPMFLISCIRNLYCQPTSDALWYTMKGNPTLSFNIDLLKREIDLMPRIGMEYYQIFPGVFDYVPDDPTPDQIDAAVGYAKKHRVRMGDYSAPNSLFCPHYNEYRNKLDRPEWLTVYAEGKSESNFCLGDSDFVDYYIDTIVTNCKRYGFEMHCLDYLDLRPCYATNHGHPPGEDSVYHQVKGLTRALEAINGVSPRMLTWSNAGNWQDFLPKLAWTNPNLYLTDPYINEPWQGLNMTRLLDDVRRAQMVSLHNTTFMPYRFFTNYQYLFCLNSVSPDIRNFEYGVLSSIAVTPNLGLGEILPWLDKLPETDRPRVISFYKHWTGFLKRNYRLWKTTYQAGENPGMGSVEIYSHAEGSSGFVFIVNPQYWGRTVEVPLDERLGFGREGFCEIEELHPIKRLRLTAQGPFARLGSTLPIHVPAQQVVVLEVRPAPERITEPRLYGLPGNVEADGNGYLVKTSGPQGSTERFAVLLPHGKRITGAVVRPDVPKQAERLRVETTLRVLSTSAKGTAMEVTFRGEAAPAELLSWRARAGCLSDGLAAGWQDGLTGAEALRYPLFVDTTDDSIGLPLTDERAAALGLGPLADFCGGYIENAFSEDQETWIELKTDGESAFPDGKLLGEESPPVKRPLPAQAKDMAASWWLETSFHLPFMYGLGYEPAQDEHTVLVLPLVRQARVAGIRAWINGLPLEVREYQYPRNRKLACFYADLVGTGAHGGDNKLVVQYTVGEK
jgi:hypothetical protein